AMRFIHAVALTFWLFERSLAIPWVEPLPTPQGYLRQAGVSPRPTEAPGLNGIPNELLRRQEDIIYPPPAGWCGFVTGDYSKQDYGDYCGSSCERNDGMLKCSDSDTPYCNTYRFPGATRLYNCDSTTNTGLSVENLADYYVTAIGSTLDASQGLFSLDEESSSGSRTRASYTPRYTYSPDSYTSSSSYSDSGAGLSAGAIRGIAIGVSLGVCLVFILLAIFIVKRRRANRVKRAAQPNLPPAYSPGAPMQQQPPPPSNPAYQPVAQQDPSYQGGYFAPEAVGKNNGTSVMTQPSVSPSALQTPQQRHSAAPSSFLSPNAGDQGRESFYRGPVSPTITEVDGSGRPLPEADSIQRPTSTHQGMVSPMTSASPPPPNTTSQYGQHYAQSQPGQQTQGQVQNGYVPPRAGTHEAPVNHAYSGPYEMPNRQH
ncbi:MAG: hypothetical protein Q9180_007061, partial [Flavoplaca navasiana]